VPLVRLSNTEQIILLRTPAAVQSQVKNEREAWCDSSHRAYKPRLIIFNLLFPYFDEVDEKGKMIITRNAVEI